MADNVVAQSPTVAGTTFATDDIGGVHYPRSKIVWGPDGTANDADVASGKAIPVQLRSPLGDSVVDDTNDAVKVVNSTAGNLLCTASQGGTWNIATVTTVSAVTSITNTVTVDSELPAAAALADNTANPTTPSVGTFPHVYDGATWDRWTGAVSQSGTWNIGTVTTVSTITNVVHVDDNAGSLTVDAPVGTPVFVRLSDGSSAITTLPVSIAATVTVDTELPAAGALSDNMVNPTTALVGSCVLIYDGATWDRWTGAVTQSGTWNIGTVTTVSTLTTITNVVHVDDNAGSITVDAPVATPVFVRLSDGSSAITTLPVSAVGTVAHGSTDAGNPLGLGAKALSADQTAVDTTDRVSLISDLVGKLINLPYAIPENGLSGTVTLTTTANSSAIAAQAAGVRIFLTSLAISNSSTTFTEINIKDGTTIKAVYPAPGLGGAVHNLIVPLRGTAATDLAVNAVTAVTSVKVTVFGYKGV